MRVLTQPNAPVPLTVYVVVIVGVTTTFAPVKAPGFQVYVVAPEAESVEVFPGQITVGEEVAVIVGPGETTTVVVAAEVHVPLAPITVYTVVDAGFTDTVAPVNDPGFQV